MHDTVDGADDRPVLCVRRLTKSHDGLSWAKILLRNRGVGAEITCLALASAAMAERKDYEKRRHTVLDAIVPAFMVAILGLALAPAAHAAAPAASLSVTSTWQTGFIASFTVLNSTPAPLADWKLEFDLPAGESVSHTWNSTIAQSGTHFVLTPANWNRIIAPGGSATGGMRGVLTGTYSPPQNCMLNQQYRCT